ncbi:hemin uptake protein HemP [Aliiroseovarius crassostreae]|uniref:hemin uptake protein HemP n=1 Tax=Aliiroseovarius crassostreae TaxID=154981 RepID=UPI003C79B9F8
MTAQLHTADFTTVQNPLPPQYDALALTRNGKTAQIALNGMVYTLTVTRAGKLILTK